MIWILGIDPGNPTGWAYIEVDHGWFECIDWGEIKNPDGAKALRLLRRLDYCDEVKVFMAIEGQFIPAAGGRGDKERHKAVSSLKTSLHAGGWIYLAQSLDLQIYRYSSTAIGIQPHVWREARLLGYQRWLSADKCKLLAIHAAKLRHGIEIPTSKHHAAEALHIAAYAGDEILRRKKTNG